MKMDEENEKCRPLFVIVNAGDNFNMMEEVNRVVVNALEGTLTLLHSMNKVLYSLVNKKLFFNNTY